MKNKLQTTPVTDRLNLVSSSVAQCINNWTGSTPQQDLLVAEIDPIYAGGKDLCSHYGVEYSSGANCIIIEAVRNSNINYVACLIPVGERMDLGGFVRRYLGVRRVSVAPKDFVLEQTQMEYGSITPFGLPIGWRILVDSKLISVPRVVIGGGLKHSKLCVPGTALLELPGAESLIGLGLPE